MVDFDERVGIKLDSGITEEEAERQARAEMAPQYREWAKGRAPAKTRRGRTPQKGCGDA